jgi:ribonuclease Z|tara:strand:+ start:382 stop:1287 length:906 start_codon:yes stop_codon:yes gene_type:complete
MLKLVFLGTSAAMPTTNRGLTCICLVRDNEILMFDAGEGAQISYLKAGLPWNKKMKIFVTHLHGDHCVGILGLLQTMNMQSRTEPVEIFGPEGIDEFIATNIKILNFGLSFPVIITPIQNEKITEENEYYVLACEAQHGIPAFSYRYQEKERVGKFFPEKAKALGIPEGKAWNQLQNGNSVEVDGKIIHPADVTGEKRVGKNIGISGDTRPTKSLINFFENCDYLSFDSTFSDELKDRARETNHSTAREAAEFAKKAGVEKLILTHFSARYKNEDLLLDEAKKIHQSTIAAKDLMEIEIHR